MRMDYELFNMQLVGAFQGNGVDFAVDGSAPMRQPSFKGRSVCSI